MKKIIISIVTIVYNDHNHIERTIHSVLDQDYPYIDYVIVDGASTDGTKECIYRYEAFLGTLISEPDKGIYDAMNKGLQAVKGNYVLFMNSGDCFERSVSCKQNRKLHQVFRVFSGAGLWRLSGIFRRR